MPALIRSARRALRKEAKMRYLAVSVLAMLVLAPPLDSGLGEAG